MPVPRFSLAFFVMASCLFVSLVPVPLVFGQAHLGEPATFDSAITYPFADLPVGDFNEDGHLDVIVFGRGDLSVLLGDGHGGFGPPSLVTFGHLVSAIDLADFDADGHLDALVVREGGQAADILLILYGAGDGTFASPVVLAGLLRKTVAVLACDLDGDGDVDVAAGNQNDITVYHNEGGLLSLVYDSELAFARQRPLGKSDFNGDGRVDLVCGDPGADRVAVLLADEFGGYEDAVFYSTGTGAEHIAVADFDGDEIDDLVVTMQSRDYSFLRGDGSGGFVHVATVDTVSTNGPVIAADLDGDFDADFVTFSDWHRTLAVYQNDGTGDFALSAIFSAGDAPGAFAIGDFDEDGRPDIGLSNRPRDLSVLLNDGAGGFDTARGVVVPNVIRSMVLADFDNDERSDFAVIGEDHTLAIFLQDSNGEFVNSYEAGGWAGRSVRATGDFNGDGNTDLVTVDHFGVPRLSVVLGDGAGGATSEETISEPFGVGSVVVGNFNPQFDDHLDVAVGLLDAPGVTVFEGDGAGGLTRGETSEFELPNTSLCTADLDHDGFLDLVSNRGVLRFGTEFGVFPDVVDLDEDATHTAIGDLDADGNPDLVFIQPSTLTAYLGDGARGFGEGIDFEHGLTTLRGVALSDIDGDGLLDIAMVDRNRLSVFVGDGEGGFGAGVDVATSTDAWAMAAGDIDRDGLADLAVGGDGGNLVTIHLNRAFFYGCRTGTVNAGIGPIEDVLFVNGSAGYGAARKVVVDRDEPLEIFMAAAPADPSSVYALYAYLAPPTNSSVRVMPFGVGRSCRATPVTDMNPAKLKRIWNNTGKAALGVPDSPSSGAPETTLHLPGGVGLELTFYLQGIISDSGSAATKPGSMTNGVVVVAK